MVSVPLNGPRHGRAGVVQEDVRRALERAGTGHAKGAGCVRPSLRFPSPPGNRRVAVGGVQRSRQLHSVRALGREIAAGLTAGLRRDLPLQARAALSGRRRRRRPAQVPRYERTAPGSLGEVGEFEDVLEWSMQAADPTASAATSAILSSFMIAVSVPLAPAFSRVR